MDLEDLVAVVAVSFTVVFAWPQVFRVLRHGVAGISVGAITLSMVGASAWLGYGIAEGLAPVIVANLGVMTGQLVVTTELVRHRALPGARAVGAVVAAGVLIGLSQLGALTEPIVTVAGLVTIVSVAVQLIEVVREPHRLEGLSAGTYAILTAVSVSWIVYGIARRDVVIIATNAVVLPMAVFVSWSAWRSHHEVVAPAAV